MVNSYFVVHFRIIEVKLHLFHCFQCIASFFTTLFDMWFILDSLIESYSYRICKQYALYSAYTLNCLLDFIFFSLSLSLFHSLSVFIFIFVDVFAACKLIVCARSYFYHCSLIYRSLYLRSFCFYNGIETKQPTIIPDNKNDTHNWPHQQIETKMF